MTGKTKKCHNILWVDSFLSNLSSTLKVKTLHNAMRFDSVVLCGVVLEKLHPHCNLTCPHAPLGYILNVKYVLIGCDCIKIVSIVALLAGNYHCAWL